MSDYVIGIDGGGTRARVFAAGRNMEALYEASGGGVGLSSLPVQRVQENLSRLLGACFASDSLSQSRCRCVCLPSTKLTAYRSGDMISAPSTPS